MVGLVRSGRGAAEADFVAAARRVRGGGGSAGGQEEQIAEADRDAEPESEALNDVGPDDGFDAADQGVEDGDDADQDDDGSVFQPGHAADGEGQQVEDEAHLGEVAERIGDGGIDAGADSRSACRSTRRRSCATAWRKNGMTTAATSARTGTTIRPGTRLDQSAA